MMACDWPGNVRELENAVIRGIYLSTGNVIEVEDLGLAAPASQVEGHEGPLLFKDAKRAAVASFEREYLGRLLSQFRGNITNAARAAGKDRRDLGRLLKKHRLDPKAYLLRQEIA